MQENTFWLSLWLGMLGIAAVTVIVFMTYLHFETMAYIKNGYVQEKQLIEVDPVTSHRWTKQ